MAEIIISNELRDKFRATAFEVELVDESGEKIGRLIRYTKVGDYYCEGEWPPNEREGNQPGRMRPAAEVTVMLQKLTEAMA